MKELFLSILVVFGFSSLVYPQTLSNADSIPVRVSYFNAAATSNNKTRLNWKVVCFLQFANFEVQRSSNGKDYITIDSFTADRIRCQSPFDFEDATFLKSTYYRLKVGDKDGNFSTSKVAVALGKVKSFEINSLTPSLVSANTVLSLSSSQNNNVTVSINSFSGSVVKLITTTLTKGVTDIKLSLSELVKGNYILVVSTELEVKTVRFTKL